MASNLTLKAITVGHGVQNYTCANSSATAELFGALAILYDITDLYPGTFLTGLSEDEFLNLTSVVLDDTDLTLNVQDPEFARPDAIKTPEDAFVSQTNPFPAPAPLLLSREYSHFGPRPFKGHHYFNDQGIPTFDLSKTLDSIVSGKTVQTLTAPSTSNKGLLDTGAVSWLALDNKGDGIPSSYGPVTAVFRVLTAGGAAVSCSEAGAGHQSIPYAAQYWLYS